jgi:hypothetical protein
VEAKRRRRPPFLAPRHCQLLPLFQQQKLLEEQKDPFNTDYSNSTSFFDKDWE